MMGPSMKDLAWQCTGRGSASTLPTRRPVEMTPGTVIALPAEV